MDKDVIFFCIGFYESDALFGIVPKHSSCKHIALSKKGAAFF
jgi:hypothetical protein